MAPIHSSRMQAGHCSGYFRCQEWRSDESLDTRRAPCILLHLAWIENVFVLGGTSLRKKRNHLTRTVKIESIVRFCNIEFPVICSQYESIQVPTRLLLENSKSQNPAVKIRPGRLCAPPIQKDPVTKPSHARHHEFRRTENPERGAFPATGSGLPLVAPGVSRSRFFLAVCLTTRRSLVL